MDEREIVILLVAVFAVLLLFGGFWMMLGWPIMGGMMGGMMGFGWGIWPLVPILLVTLVVIGVYLVSTALRGGGRPPQPPTDRALEILRERYARGEITKEEFDRMRKDLEGRV